jgi:hypothetical protein
MPHATFRVTPGVVTNETPALNTAGVSTSQLIRFKPDKNGLGLVEKLGGWSKFYAGQMPAIVRQLLAWEDLNSNEWVAAGMQTGISGYAYLGVLAAILGANGITTGQNFQLVTPLFLSSDIAPVFSTTAGSQVVTITDTVSQSISTYDAVYIADQVSVGGLVLFGVYPVYQNLTTTTYTILATNILGAPLYATATSTSAAVPSLTTTATSANVAVVLANHGYSVGSTFPILIPTTVGGVTFYGNYVVTAVADANDFTFVSKVTATTTATGSINGGNVRFIYSAGGAPTGVVVGYGQGGYGAGGYGVGSGTIVNIGAPTGCTDWSLDNWGGILLASPTGAVVDGIGVSGIYQWDPTSGATVAAAISQAPPVNDGFFVAMPQRQIMAWGSTFTGIQDPLLVRWCDISNFNIWVATVTNQAGSYRIPRGSKIVGGIQASQQSLLWTDLALWSVQYISQPYVYSFNEIAAGCGLIGRRGACVLGENVYWMSQSQFFSLTGGGVSILDCPVWDVIFQDLDLNNLQKIRCAPNSRFGEVTWFYPVIGGSGEPTNYVKYNTILGAWDYGVLDRSAWINQSVVGPPLGYSPINNYIYQHEISPDADGVAMVSSFSSGYAALSDGDDKIFVDEIWPDMKWGYFGGSQNATVNLTIGVKDFPSQAPFNIGPFAFNSSTTFVSPRARGRLMQISVGSQDIGSFWRLGGIRYRGEPDGKF